MGKVALTPLRDTSPFRKIAMGTWKTAKDPSVYGLVEIDMQPALEMLPDYCEQKGVRVTPSHLVGKAAAYCMKRRPEINGMIRGSKIYLRDHVSLFYQVNVPGKGDDKIKRPHCRAILHEVEKMTVADIAKSLKDKASDVRNGQDKEFTKNINAFKFMPWWFARFYLDLASFLIYGLNLNLSRFGIPKDPFGSCMITNVGSLGIDIAYAPLCPYTRVPILLTLGGIQEKAWVVDGEIKIRPILPVSVTFDHRLIDGIHASQMAADFKKCFADPATYLFND